jgi:hypothetical protein
MRGDARQGDRARHSRRELMAGAAGVLSVLTAETLVKAAPARAAQGSNVIEGADNTGATHRTGVFTTGNAEVGILADPNNSGFGSLGVYRHAQDIGVRGDAVGGGLSRSRRSRSDGRGAASRRASATARPSDLGPPVLPARPSKRVASANPGRGVGGGPWSRAEPRRPPPKL